MTTGTPAVGDGGAVTTGALAVGDGGVASTGDAGPRVGTARDERSAAAAMSTRLAWLCTERDGCGSPEAGCAMRSSIGADLPPRLAKPNRRVSNPGRSADGARVDSTRRDEVGALAGAAPVSVVRVEAFDSIRAGISFASRARSAGIVPGEADGAAGGRSAGAGGADSAAIWVACDADDGDTTAGTGSVATCVVCDGGTAVGAPRGDAVA